MDVFVARQPIFNAAEIVVGYELLHRTGGATRYDGADGTAATRQLLSEHLLDDAAETLTGGVPAWVNFPAAGLLDGSALLVPPDRLVVELLEDIVPDDAVVAACADLRAHGYTLAADDVVDAGDANPLLDLVDIVKVDFLAADVRARRDLAARFGGRVRLLAEKVETRTDQTEAIDLGYELLQGYFLREPVTVSRRTIDRTKVGMLAVLAAVSAAPMDFLEVEHAIKRDVAFTDRLLRYLNSAAFGWRDRITTIHQALVALGERQVRRWVTVSAIAAAGADTHRQLVVSTVWRARMCELVAELAASDISLFEAFLTGLYSRVHLLVQTDFMTMIDQAPVPAPVREALLEEAGPLAQVLALVEAWERGSWEQVAAVRRQLGIDAADLSDCYVDAVRFAEASDERAPVRAVESPVGIS